MTADTEPNERQTSSIKQPERIRIFTNHHGHGVVVKDLAYTLASSQHVGAATGGETYGRDILARKFVGSVRYQKTSLQRRISPVSPHTHTRVVTHLSNSTVPHDNTLDGLHGVEIALAQVVMQLDWVTRQNHAGGNTHGTRFRTLPVRTTAA